MMASFNGIGGANAGQGLQDEWRLDNSAAPTYGSPGPFSNLYGMDAQQVAPHMTVPLNDQPQADLAFQHHGGQGDPFNHGPLQPSYPSPSPVPSHLPGPSYLAVQDDPDPVNTMIAQLGRQGYKYTQISEIIFARLGVEITPNAICKRYLKQESIEKNPSWLAIAIQNSMPNILQIIETQLATEQLMGAHLPGGGPSPEDVKESQELMAELSTKLPKWIHREIVRKRGGAQAQSPGKVG
ncbi:hypothetical protein QBC34DRAFT_57729 [Podospora aff. communis PSN243]|uniref:Uncharacterized protein n=1 Tax=Podospora aff. communis PSN243 TaxID=3040156 RepID=A0AAV9GU00_9PEZI|nr:hypothetical protein QBC34DRAFT_57729 [Podospora aff. communis PSN243]